MNARRIKVSSKRQITIPKDYCEKLKIGKQVEIYLDGNRICIEPVNDFYNFAELILADLKKEGYSGDELEAKLLEMKSKLEAAFLEAVQEARAEYDHGETKEADTFLKELGD